MNQKQQFYRNKKYFNSFTCLTLNHKNYIAIFYFFPIIIPQQYNFNIMENKTAVFIDCENIQNPQKIKFSLNYIEKNYPNVFNRTVIGNFLYNSKIMKLIKSENLISIPTKIGENSADMRICWEVLQVLKKNPNLTHICLMTNDSDYSMLLQLLDKYGIQITIFGFKTQLPNSLLKYQTVFMDDLVV